MPICHERVHEMAAYEASTTSYKNLRHITLSCLSVLEDSAFTVEVRFAVPGL
jgi:hypothetical protein